MGNERHIIDLELDVPYRGSGGVVQNNKVPFSVHADGEYFHAIPKLNKDQRRVANLPEELVFKLENGKPVSRRGPAEGNLGVIDQIFTRMKENNVL